MARSKAWVFLVGLFLVLMVLFWFPGRLEAGLNTDVALTPPEGGTIVRTQWRFSRLSDDPTAKGRKVYKSIEPITVVYGITEKLAILGKVPLVQRRIKFSSGGTKESSGIADVTLLGKYRFYQLDRPGQTIRWAMIAGGEIPTYDKGFSSESFDPIIGTVWTYQRQDWWVDWDILYKFNTAGGMEGDDSLKADVAYSYLLKGGQSPRLGIWGFYAVSEINALYLTDGSSVVFASPGLQLIARKIILEASIQLPVHQITKSPRLETDYTVVLSLRFQF